MYWKVCDNLLTTILNRRHERDQQQTWYLSEVRGRHGIDEADIDAPPGGYIVWPGSIELVIADAEQVPWST